MTDKHRNVTGRTDLCPDCGHHIHGQKPCQWTYGAGQNERLCPCPAVRLGLDPDKTSLNDLCTPPSAPRSRPMSDDTLRAAVRRLLDEYWEDNSRPPSFVTIGDLKAALASVPDEGPLSFANVRKAITDAYYDTRDEGGTMETAADLAATRVMNLYSQAARPAAAPAPDPDLANRIHDAEPTR